MSPPGPGPDRAVVTEVAATVARWVPWLRVRAASPGEPELAWSWSRAGLLAPGDPTRSWRVALAASTEEQYASPPPPAMPAAFVLQWALEAPATLGAYAAVFGPSLADLTPGSVSFATDPVGHHPSVLQLRGAVVTGASRDERLARAEADYRALVTPFADGYHPGVRLGPHQRRGLVADVWAIAVRRALQAALPPPPPPEVERESCCYIYTLPGAIECAGCPRLRRRAGSR